MSPEPRSEAHGHDAAVYLSDTLPAQHIASVLVGAGFEVGPFHPVERTALDTFDGRLHAAGIRLEICDRDGLQLTVRDGGPAPVRVHLDRVPRVSGDLPLGPLRARLAPLLDVRALQRTISASALHASAVRRNDSAKVVVCVDIYVRPATRAGETLWPCAAELSPLQGYARAARQTEDLLASLELARHDGDLLALAAVETGIDLRGFVSSPTVPLDPSEPAAGGFRRVLANLADTMEANRQGTIDDVDPEFLHDLRVAVRRSRSVLSHGKRVLAADGRDHFRAEFRWLGEVTGRVRDLDVYMIEWPGYVATLDSDSTAALEPVVDHIHRRRAAEQMVLAGHLDSARYQGLMTAWRAWLDSPATGEALAKHSQRPLGTVIVARIQDAQDQLLTRGRGIGPSTAADELHELRKDAKRLRYLLECFGGLLPAQARKPFVQRLKALQDNLGEHQDTEVHTAQLMAMSEELHGTPGVTAGTLVAIGRLAEVFDRRRRAAREEFAERFARYDTKQTAQALDDVVQAVS